MLSIHYQKSSNFSLFKWLTNRLLPEKETRLKKYPAIMEPTLSIKQICFPDFRTLSL